MRGQSLSINKRRCLAWQSVRTSSNRSIEPPCSDNYVAVLASLPLSKQSFVLVDGTLTLNGGPKSAVALLAGAPIVARVKDGVGNIIVHGRRVGLLGSGAEVIVAGRSFIVGSSVSISSVIIPHH